MTDPVLAWELRKAQTEVEYGTYRALYPIAHDGVIAYQPGSAVPISNVKKYGYDRDGLVERVDGEPLDAPLPEGAAPLVEEPAAGEGWIEPEAPAPLPQGQTINLEGKAVNQPGKGKAVDPPTEAEDLPVEEPDPVE